MINYRVPNRVPIYEYRCYLNICVKVNLEMHFIFVFCVIKYNYKFQNVLFMRITLCLYENE